MVRSRNKRPIPFDGDISRRQPESFQELGDRSPNRDFFALSIHDNIQHSAQFRASGGRGSRSRLFLLTDDQERPASRRLQVARQHEFTGFAR
jgi:hypothetical protein